MTTRLRVATSGGPAYADDIGGAGVPGNVLTRVAVPGAPDNVLWGAGGGSLAQLTNTRWVDKNTTVPLVDQTGTVGAPFSTLAAGILALAATGGTLLILPGDYSAEGAPDMAVDGAFTVGFINVAGAQVVPGDASGLQEVVLPGLVGSASKFVQGCTCGNLTSSNLHVSAVSSEIHGVLLAHLNARLWGCSFTRDAGVGYNITVELGTLSANQCFIRGAGDLFYLPAGHHQVFGCTFGAGTGLVDGPAPGVVVEFDPMTHFNYDRAYGANFGANANPQIISLPEIRIGSGVVPALAAGALDYLDVNVAVAGLPAIAEATRVNVYMNADLAAAGAGAGFMPYARVSAPDTVRLTFVGALAGGLTDFVFSFG